MQTVRKACSVLLFSVLGACAGSQSARVATNTQPVSAPAPAPAPAPPAEPAPTEPPAAPSPPEHTEAHLSHGHITLEHQILFDTDSDHIQEQASQGPLNDLIAVLRENSQVRKVRIEGHTDTRGAAARNRDLSQRRAAAVAEYLRSHGLSNIEFEPVGYGSSQPVCREDTDECHDRNRRVEFTITDPAEPAQPAQ